MGRGPLRPAAGPQPARLAGAPRNAARNETGRRGPVHRHHHLAWASSPGVRADHGAAAAGLRPADLQHHAPRGRTAFAAAGAGEGYRRDREPALRRRAPDQANPGAPPSARLGRRRVRLQELGRFPAPVHRQPSGRDLCNPGHHARRAHARKHARRLWSHAVAGNTCTHDPPCRVAVTDRVAAGPLGDSGSYALVDFVPFTAEVYLRLLERVGESSWPLHLATLVLGVAAMILMWRGRGRIACVLLAAPWAWVGITFFEQRYAQLNWAGGWFAGAFLVQAAGLLLLAAMGAAFDRGAATTQRSAHSGILQQGAPLAGGLILAGFGVLAYPVIGPLSGSALFQAETCGIHPDPTAVATLGILFAGLRGFGLWLAVLIPALWCLITGLTLYVLDAPWTQIPLAVAVLALVLALWKTLRST